jgi:hypothetical protein
MGNEFLATTRPRGYRRRGAASSSRLGAIRSPSRPGLFRLLWSAMACNGDLDKPEFTVRQ